MSVSNIKQVHWMSGLAGVFLLVLGLLVIAYPPLEETLPLPAVLTGPVALLAIALGLYRARVRQRNGVDHLELPIPELPFALPAPGDDFDEMVYRYVHRGEKTLEYPEQIGERLREVAIQVISHREECTRDQALDLLEEGAWTDNETAAAYFSDRVSTPDTPLDERLRNMLGGGENRYELRLRETVDAIVRTAELVQEPESEPETDDERGFFSRFFGGDDDEDRAAIDGERKSVLEYELDDDLPPGQVQYFETSWTGRWLGVESFAFIAAGIGVLLVRPELILAGSVAVAYAAYARLEGEPVLDGLAVERTVDDPNPAPGDEVHVTLTVENRGGSLAPDLRLIDLVPPNMRVVDGSARLHTALRPGEEATMRYTIVAERGIHEWPLLAVTSGFAGTIEREGVVEVEGTIECYPRLRTVAEVPVRAQTSVFEGQVETERGGAGLEFHSVREYQPSDPMRRVEWKRLARTGQLATVDLREEHAATVVLLFDAREGAYVADEPGSRHALDRSVDAATEVYAALADKGDLVGVAAFDTVPCWLSPSAGTGHDEQARRLFAHHPALSSLPPEMQELEGGYIDPMTHIRRQLPAGAQIMLFSPLVSDYVVDVARQLDSSGHRVTVISPNPTADRTPGQRLARVERATRMNRLREQGVRVVDWEADDTLALTFQRAKQRWYA